MPARLIAAICASLTLFGASHPVSGQTLNAIRSEVRPAAASVAASTSPDEDVDDHSANSSRRRRRYDDCHEPSHHWILDEIVGKLFIGAIAAPFIIPRYALEDDGTTGYFADYPYDGQSFSMAYDGTIPGTQNSMVLFQSDIGTNFNGLLQTHGRLLIDGNWRLGIDSEFYHRYEQRPGNNDQLWNGDVNLVYRFAENEKWQFRTGLGMNWMSDRFGSDAGFNATYSVDWFPTDPMVYHGSMDIGKLGNATLLHFRNTIGLTRRGWGIFTGHDFFRVGSARTHSWINGIEFRY